MTSEPSPVSPARVPVARSGLRLAALLLVGALALAGCSGDDLLDKNSSQEESEGATLSRTSPLTGEVLSEQPGHPILTIKVDNSGSAQQVGLGKADLVVEELVEGGTTRLATFFYSSLPPRVGPVRSMRATDVGIVSPLKAVLVASGAAAPTWRVVRKAKIKTVTERNGRGYFRGPGAAPYNLFMDVKKLVKPMKPLQRVPEPYLPFGDEPLPKGKPAKRFTAAFSQAADSNFVYRGKRYVTTDAYFRKGDAFVADTVLVLRVKVRPAGYTDPAGFPVPETRFTGRGPATVFHQGRRVEATWVKKGLEAPMTLQAQGKDLELPPGKVRIELVPRSGGSLRVG